VAMAEFHVEVVQPRVDLCVEVEGLDERATQGVGAARCQGDGEGHETNPLLKGGVVSREEVLMVQLVVGQKCVSGRNACALTLVETTNELRLSGMIWGTRGSAQAMSWWREFEELSERVSYISNSLKETAYPERIPERQRPRCMP
jgi:hypothetical protein